MTSDSEAVGHVEVFIETDDHGRGEGQRQEMLQWIPIPKLQKHHDADGTTHLHKSWISEGEGREGIKGCVGAMKGGVIMGWSVAS